MREHADRRVAGGLERAHDLALGVQRGVRARVVGGLRGLRGGRAGAGLDGDHALTGGRHEDPVVQDRARLGAATQPVEAGRGEDQHVDLARDALGQARVDVPAQLADLEVRPRGEQLRAAAQRAGPDAGALAHVRERVLADQHVERLGPAGRGGDLGARRELPRDVLGGVDGEVDLARQQRGLQRAHPARLVAARAVHVAGGGDLHELDVAADQPRDLVRLRQRERAAAGAEPRDRRVAPGHAHPWSRRTSAASSASAASASSRPNSSRSSCRRA